MLRIGGSFCALVALLMACGGGSSAAPVGIALTAAPSEALVGDPVELLPTFPRGVGRIEPGVGPVVSGGRYSVGPLAGAQRFTLTVTDGAAVTTRSIDVPVRYRERVVALAASPNARTRHGSVLLGDGRVLLVAGTSLSSVFWNDGELFDPVLGSFAAAGTLSTSRSESQVVALPDDRVLAFGGPINGTSFEEATRVELWSPAPPGWVIAGNMLCNRQRHTATRLADGRVLVVGGLAIGPLADRDAEVWVPGTGARPAAGNAIPRAAHSATALADGRVLIAGGLEPPLGAGVLVAELFDPATETFVPTGSLQVARAYHAAVPLRDGRVLLIGGDGDGILAATELFDPVTGRFGRSGDLVEAVTEVRAVELVTGDVLVVGGLTASGAATRSLQLWQRATGVFRRLAAELPEPLTGHSLHVLADGRVLVFGGDPGTGFPIRSTLRID